MMRTKFVAGVAITSLLALAACTDPRGSAPSGQSDELTAALVAIAEGQSRRTGDDEIRRVIREEIELATRSQTGTLRELQTELSALSTRLRDVVTSSSESDGELRTLRRDMTTVREAVQTLEGIRARVDALAAVDPQDFVRLTREMGEKDGELLRLQAQLESARERQAERAAQVGELNTAIEQQRARIRELEGGDVSQHPDVIAMNAKIQEFERRVRGLERERENLRQYVATLEAGGARPGRPGEPEAEPRDPYDPDFRAEIYVVDADATQADGRPEYFVLARMTKGNVPPKDEVLVVVNEAGEEVCELRVINQRHDEPVGFGGRTTNASQPNRRNPTVGDVVRRRVGGASADRPREAQGR